MDDLKPCPFCGNRATLSRYYVCDGYQNESPTYRAHCTDCHAKMEHSSKEVVITEWNTRDPDADHIPHPTVLMSLCAAIENLQKEIKYRGKYIDYLQRKLNQRNITYRASLDEEVPNDS